MIVRLLLGIILMGMWNASTAQRKNYVPKIVPCNCRFMIDSNFLKTAPPLVRAEHALPFPKIDSSFKTRCGYLLVPENRSKAKSKTVKLPFIVLESKNPNKRRDPLLFTSGGPGNSSLSWILGATKGDLIKDRDLIAFEQRGTRYAWPYLRVFDLDNAIRDSYRKNLNKDSMVLVGVKKYRKTLEQKGIELAGYTTDETVSDIHDLLKVLQVDSINLYGGSYSGGLMTAVLQKDPSRIRSLVLDSPLPMFAAIDEDEPKHFNEALTKLFSYVAQDSTNTQRYGNLHERFLKYFNGIAHQTFYLRYLEKGTTDSVNIAYTKNELLAEIMDAMSDNSRRKDVAYIITDMMSGNHQPYVKHYLDALFRKYQAPDGMRISVYCADQAAYHSEDVIKQLYQMYPYLTAYRINDVIKDMCDCWPTPPVKPSTKQPYYSLKPVLMADGEMDPNCSPLYLQRLKHYLPNAQGFLFLKRGHGVGGKDWNQMMREFLNNPQQRVQVNSSGIVAL